MTTTVTKPASLWRETFRDILQFAKAEWRWLVVFAAIIAIERRLLAATYDLNDMMRQIKEVQGNQEEILKIVRVFLPGIVFSAVSNVATGLVSAYVFTVLYLRRGAEDASLFGIKSFFRWLGRIVQKYLILVCPLLLVLVVLGFMATPSPSAEMQQTYSVILAGLLFLWMFYFICGLYLLYLVTPAALLRKGESALAISFKMTKNELLRVWWGSMMVIGIVYTAFFPLILVNALALHAFGLDASQGHAVGTIIDSAMQACVDAGVAVYACVAYRVLQKEQAAKTDTSNV
ncbi:MAG: hypothetical protein WC464_05080 [Bdellovibrionales bacterium]